MPQSSRTGHLGVTEEFLQEASDCYRQTYGTIAEIDYAFKEIMTDEQARIGFLSAVLNLNPADVRKTELLNTSLRKLHEDEKQGIVDVRILMNNNTEIGPAWFTATQKTDNVMKKIYMQTFPEEREKVDDMIDNYFEDIIQHEIQYKIKKPSKSGLSKEHETGFEPATLALARRYSTTEPLVLICFS